MRLRLNHEVTPVTLPGPCFLLESGCSPPRQAPGWQLQEDGRYPGPPPCPSGLGMQSWTQWSRRAN